MLIRVTVLALLLTLPMMAGADEDESVAPATLEEAMKLATDIGKPILMEFHRYDCEHCELAAREGQSNAMMKIALETVVHFPVDVLSEPGQELAERYGTGNSFPVFILTDAKADPIGRWTGFTRADNFVGALNRVTAALVTIPECEALFGEEPTRAQATKLAKYFRSSGDHLKALHYYRELDLISDSTIRYDFQIFRVITDAVWEGLMPFDSLIPAANKLVVEPYRNPPKVGEMAQIMARVARRTGNMDDMAPYLGAGIKATGVREDERGLKIHRELLADYGLFIEHDTAAALELIQFHLGDGWETDPAKCLAYAEWCLERRVDLVQAESRVRFATDQASEGKFRARHLRVLAGILYELGRTEEAVPLMEQAFEESSHNTWYGQLLEDMKAGK